MLIQCSSTVSIWLRNGRQGFLSVWGSSLIADMCSRYEIFSCMWIGALSQIFEISWWRSSRRRSRRSYIGPCIIPSISFPSPFAARTIEVADRQRYLQALVKIRRRQEIAPSNENYHGADVHMIWVTNIVNPVQRKYIVRADPAPVSNSGYSAAW